MGIAIGRTDAWLTQSFYVERGRAYDTDNPEVAEALRVQPSAFRYVDEPYNEPEASGEKRTVKGPRNG